MSDGRRNIIRRSARLLNKAASAFYSYPTVENGFVPEDKKRILDYNNHRPYGPAQRFCYAPFSNLFFNTDGKAIVCCKNTKVVLGKYPGSSIHSMWFSEKIDRLRAYIQHNDLSHGCYKCREALHSGNYGSMTASGFDFLRAWPVSEYPRMMEFELSNVCNLECEMCSGRVSSGIRKHREGREPLKMPYDSNFVKQLEEFIPHLKQARFYGGEPFMIDIYYDIWNAFITANSNIDLYVLTNGTILNDTVKSLLERGNFTINVSVDSFQKDCYERIRVNAVFEKTMEHLHYFNDYMQRHRKQLRVFITPTRTNWREIPEMVKQCNEWNMEVYFSVAYYPETLSLWNLPIVNQKEILDFYNAVNLPENTNEKNFREMVGDIAFWYKEQQRNPDYISEFRKYASQQEEGDYIEKEEIRIADASRFRNEFSSKFEKYLGTYAVFSNESAMPDFLNRIDLIIAKKGLSQAIIYFFLLNTAKEKVMQGLAEMDNEAIAELFIRKQEELKSTHIIIE